MHLSSAEREQGKGTFHSCFTAPLTGGGDSEQAFSEPNSHHSALQRAWRNGRWGGELLLNATNPELSMEGEKLLLMIFKPLGIVF